MTIFKNDLKDQRTHISNDTTPIIVIDQETALKQNKEKERKELYAIIEQFNTLKELSNAFSGFGDNINQMSRSNSVFQSNLTTPNDT